MFHVVNTYSRGVNSFHINVNKLHVSKDLQYSVMTTVAAFHQNIAIHRATQDSLIVIYLVYFTWRNKVILSMLQSVN